MALFFSITGYILQLKEILGVSIVQGEELLIGISMVIVMSRRRQTVC